MVFFFDANSTGPARGSISDSKADEVLSGSFPTHLCPPAGWSDRMSVKDHIAKHKTPDMEILTGMDSKQLAYCASLHDHDFLVQEERYLSDGLDLNMGFSVRQSGVKTVTDAKMARMLFRGEKPKWLIVTLRKDLVTAMDNMKALFALRPEWHTVDVLVLDPADGALFDEGPRMLRDLLVNPARIYRGDRGVNSRGLKTVWTPWLIRFTGPAAATARQPEFRTLSLFSSGMDPEEIIFEEPAMKDSLMAVVAHVTWAEELCNHFEMTRHQLSETPGPDARYTKVYFMELSCQDMCDLVEKYGAKPRFGLMTIPMYEGQAVDSMPEIVEVFVTSAKRTDVALWMFSILLSELWDGGRVMVNGEIAMQSVSYCKIRVGFTPVGRKKFMAMLDTFILKGLSIKDEATGEPLTEYDSDSDASSVMSEWGSVESCMLINVPPYWKDDHIKSVLKGTGERDLLLTKMSWNVGEIRTCTWKVQSPDSKKLVGRVLKAPSGRTLLIINSAEYKERKSRKSRPSAAGMRKTPDTTVPLGHTPMRPPAGRPPPASASTGTNDKISFKKHRSD